MEGNIQGKTLSPGAAKALMGLSQTRYLSKFKGASDQAKRTIADKWRQDPRIAYIPNLDELLSQTVVLIYDIKKTSRRELAKTLAPHVRQVLACEDLEDFWRRLQRHNSPEVPPGSGGGKEGEGEGGGG
eukprot:CAMPEP_0194673556 /NCGR_PEP_ID=MMETSP0295-20121207/7129_1 /TAXON_ID=39354 /ORGANISM="Heterosigma akashiwo, Strain CCMP2393" /LENGTH=128 /DNA_ID=CAMNT_0039557515 /DNA_START=398 /DNA_END=781 /DNA_ORIENTATION=+